METRRDWIVLAYAAMTSAALLSIPYFVHPRLQGPPAEAFEGLSRSPSWTGGPMATRLQQASVSDRVD
jgi:hypothetical protein